MRTTIRFLILAIFSVSLSVQASISLPLKDGSTVELYDRSYALLIGVSDYEYWPDLPGVEEDIEAVSRSLKKHGFKVISLLNPTRTSFDNTMRDFIGDHGQDPENRLIVYYAGHGYTLTTSRGRELGYIVPADAPLPKDGAGAFKKKAISMLEIEIFAKQMESKHALFTFDSCFSGSLFEITRAVPDSISLKTSEPVRQFITAGSAEQTVPDKSVFRNQFVAGLEGEADVNKDGFITGTELAQFIEDSVTNYTRRAQTPQYGKIRDPYLDKGDFVFINPRMEITITLPNQNKPATSNTEVSKGAIELSYWDAIKSANDPEVYQAYLEEYPEGQFSKLASLLIKQAGKKQEQSRELKLEREEDFKRQQTLIAQQQAQSEQRTATFKKEQAELSKLRLALSKKPQGVTSITSEASASAQKVAVVLRGEVKFNYSTNENQLTLDLTETYKSEIENGLLKGANVISIAESSNNHSIVYDDIGGKEVKRVCQEHAVDIVVVGFIEVIDETSWPTYTVSYMNCETGSSSVRSYTLDKHREDKHRFQVSVKQGLTHFWRSAISVDLH